MVLKDKKEKQDPVPVEVAYPPGYDPDILERVRCFAIEFKGDQERFAKSPDLAFMELNDFFVERDRAGPFLRVVTETGHYRIRLEREYRIKRQSG